MVDRNPLRAFLYHYEQFFGRADAITEGFYRSPNFRRDYLESFGYGYDHEGTSRRRCRHSASGRDMLRDDILQFLEENSNLSELTIDDIRDELNELSFQEIIEWLERHAEQHSRARQRNAANVANHDENVVHGLSDDQISRLPSHKFIKSSNEDTNCMICQMEYERGDKLITLPCAHKYHKDCIIAWLKTKNTCCICKREVDV